jgi:hypothetical protein
MSVHCAAEGIVIADQDTPSVDFAATPLVAIAMNMFPTRSILHHAVLAGSVEVLQVVPLAEYATTLDPVATATHLKLLDAILVHVRLFGNVPVLVVNPGLLNDILGSMV